LSQVIAPALKTDYNPSVPVYDIRSQVKDNGIFTIGGFIGELLLVFSSLYEHMLTANPQFKFDHIDKFLCDWMKEADFPEGTCVLKITAEKVPLQEEALSKILNP
jgi:hypothetical protein